MNEILKKLQLKEGEKLFVYNLPEELKEVFDKSNQMDFASKNEKNPTAVLVFIKNETDITTATEKLKLSDLHESLIWFAYPKKSSKKYKSAINRDTGWIALGEAGFEPVRQISISEDWSGLRFRKFESIKNFTRNFAISAEGIKKIST